MKHNHVWSRRLIWPCLLLTVLLCACTAPLAEEPPIPAATQPPTSTSEVPTPAASPTMLAPTDVPTATPIMSATALPTALPSATPWPAPSSTPPAIRPLIALDPGHGGRDLGARHFDENDQMDFNESEINLDLALRLRDLLLAQGYRVIMTRDGDYGLNPQQLDLNGDEVVDHVDELQIRLDMINEAGADLLLSIHQNAFYYSPGEPAEDVGGVVTFYCQDREFGEQNLALGQAIQGELIGAFAELGYDISDRGVLDDLVLMTPNEPGTHLIVLGPESDRIVRPSQMPGILSETLFITHSAEAALIKRPASRQRLAEAYAAGLASYLTEIEAPQD